MNAEWLQEPLTLDQAEAKHSVTNDRLGPDPVPFGFQNQRWLKLKSQMVDGDELRVFLSPSESWANMCGREGISLVRNGKIVDSIVTLMN